MRGIENMSSLFEAVDDAETKQRVRSPELWRRLEQYRAASTSASSGSQTRDRERRTQLAVDLLKDVELRLLFVAVDYAHNPQHGDEVKRRVLDSVLLAIFGSSIGPNLYQENAETEPFFLAGLYHPTAGVKTLTAKTLVALAREGQAGDGRRACSGSILSPPLLPALVAVLGDNDTGAAQAAADAVVALCAMDSSDDSAIRVAQPAAPIARRRAVMAALASQVVEATDGLSEREAATPKLRFAETAARLMAVSESAFKEALEEGALALVTNLTQDSSDVLLLLNALDLLELVASTVGGARYLATNGHLAGLLAAAGGGAGDASAGPDPLLGASALRTVAKVLVKSAGVGVDVRNEVDHALLGRFLHACTVHIEGSDEAGKLGGLVAASSLAEASTEALRAMLSEEQESSGLLEAWLTLSRHKVSEKAAALHAVARVLGPPPRPSRPSSSVADEDEVMGNTAAAADRAERSALVRKLFNQLGACNNGQTTGALLARHARQPVPEIRNAAYDVLRCTMWQPGGWGLPAVFSQPGFREFLEDRDMEASKVGKEWKFSVVESVMQCQERNILGQDMLDSFKTILEQGPFWIPSKTRAVATLT